MAAFFCLLSLLLLGAPGAAGVEYSLDQLSTDQRAEFGSEVLQPLRPHPLAYMYDALAEEAC